MGKLFQSVLRDILGSIFILGNFILIDSLRWRCKGSDWKLLLVMVAAFVFPISISVVTSYYFIEIRRSIREICRNYGRIVGLIYIFSCLGAIAYFEKNNYFFLYFPLLGVIAISSGRLILDLEETLPIVSTVLAGCLSAVLFPLCTAKSYAALVASVSTIPVVMVALCALAMGDVKEWKLRAQAFTLPWKLRLDRWIDDEPDGELREYSFHRNMGLLYLGIRRRGRVLKANFAQVR
ncbi:hypothetical protein Tsubulata_017546, partial [Turnera subulata]